MQKNWYIVYTRQKCETKVAGLLTKNKIENFCPVNCSEIKTFRKVKLLYEPLFTSYVFVHIEENNIPIILKFPNVVGLVYWKCTPAIIKNDEIEAIKEFTRTYKSIKIGNTKVDIDDVVSTVDSSFYSFDAQSLSPKNNMIRVNLPSLGLVMTAQMQGDTIFKRGITFLQNPSYTN